ncbi:hypothetical protein ACFPMF_15975 [Larkinella bovis]|uniref:DUF2029 domain-containing protein n=1 Tax=Larkinella bovis TaxID=683041 RepID=A0ABW0IEJ8_9BACT
MSVLLFKIAIAVLGSVAVAGLLRFRYLIDRVSIRQQRSVLVLFFTLFRIVPFFMVYVVLNQEARSDVPVFYEAALQAMQGKMVYRDFWTPYSPLFPYVTTLLVWFWNSPKALVLLMILMEGLALGLTWRNYRSDIRDIFTRMVVYLALPGPLVLCVLGGQEDIWMWLFAVASILVWRRTRDSLWIGVVMALALMTTKALACLIVLPMLFLVDRPVRYVVGAALTGVPVLALLIALVGDKFLTPLAFADMPFAPNLWTVLGPIIGDFRSYSKILSWTGVGLTVAVSSLGALILKHRMDYAKALPILWSLCFCFMMFIHKSSFGNYAFIFLMPMLVNVIDLRNVRQVAVLLLFNGLVVVHPTYWWGLNTPVYTRWSDLNSTSRWIEYGMELALVGCLVYFLTLLYRVVTHGQSRQTDIPVGYL